MNKSTDFPVMNPPSFIERFLCEELANQYYDLSNAVERIEFLTKRISPLELGDTAEQKMQQLENIGLEERLSEHGRQAGLLLKRLFVGIEKLERFI